MWEKWRNNNHLNHNSFFKVQEKSLKLVGNIKLNIFNGPFSMFEPKYFILKILQNGKKIESKVEKSSSQIDRISMFHPNLIKFY